MKRIFTFISTFLLSIQVNAAMVNWEYSSTIDLTSFGGGSNETFRVNYFFDDAEIDTNASSTLGAFPNVFGTALIGTDSLSFSGASIGIENDNSYPYDLYKFSSTGAVTGSVLGTDILDIRFTLYDLDASMFTSDALPSDTTFTTGVDTGWRFLRDVNNPSGVFQAASFSHISDGPFFTLSEIPVTAPVPVPAAVWLFGSGLLGLIGFSKRKKAA